MNPEKKTKGYEVGYGRPPLNSRFKKGQSGNPTGRRRYTESERGRRLLRQEANRLVTLREGDKVVRMPAVQAAMRSLFYAAAKGKASALRMVLGIMNLDPTGSREDTNNPSEQSVRWLAPEPPTPKEMLQSLDLKHLSDEQLDQFEALLTLCLEKESDTTQS